MAPPYRILRIPDTTGPFEFPDQASDLITGDLGSTTLRRFFRSDRLSTPRDSRCSSVTEDDNGGSAEYPDYRRSCAPDREVLLAGDYVGMPATEGAAET